MEKGLKKFQTRDDEGLFYELVDEYVYTLCLGRELREGLENEVGAQATYVHYEVACACVWGHITTNVDNLGGEKRVRIKEYDEMVCAGCCLEKWNLPQEVRELILKYAFAPILFLTQREELVGQIIGRIKRATGVKVINQRIV
jgi:hypothetical protein